MARAPSRTPQDPQAGGWSARRPLMSGFVMIASGVFAGANRANQDETSKSGNPDSIIVGMSGSAGLRVAVVTARAFILPALICGSAGGRLSNIRSTSFAISAMLAAAVPRYGIWTM